MPTVDPEILQATIGMTDEAMLEYFRSLGYDVSWDWQQAGQAVKDRAFSMANVTKLDLLQDVRESLQQGIEEGLDFKGFVETFRERLMRRGWVTDEIAPWRLDLVYDQWIQNSYMAGRWEGSSGADYLKYIAVVDKRTTQICRGLDGKIFPRTDPFWDSFYPPNHFRCRARTRSVSQDEVDEDGLTVDTSDGKIEKTNVVTNVKKGTTRKVKTYRDGEETLTPGAGFDFNVGKKGFKPKLNGYDKDLRDAFNDET